MTVSTPTTGTMVAVGVGEVEDPLIFYLNNHILHL